MNAGVPPPLWREALPAIESKPPQYDNFKEEFSQGTEEIQSREKENFSAPGKPPVKSLI